jgi:small subunit ribosomal protein S4
MVKSKLKKKYSGPSHLWQIARIKEEADLRNEYGYKNKKEIWKMYSILRKFRAQARRLIPLTDKQAQLEKKQLLTRLALLGLVKENAQIEDVLALKVKDVLERRLQTLVLRKRFANTVKQARQMITHGHIVVGEKKITSPSHLVTIKEEPHISFQGSSPFMSEMHPERVAGSNKREKKKEIILPPEKLEEIKQLKELDAVEGK